MDRIARELEAPPERRQQRVKELCDTVRTDLDHWGPDFKRMRENRGFTRGLQWESMGLRDINKPQGEYVENFTLRHVKQRVASIYARNPTFHWRRSKRLHHRLWDGTAESLRTAMEAAAPSDMNPAGDPAAQAVVQEYLQSTQTQKQLRAVGETLTIAYEYSLREQVHSTKRMLKRMVTTSAICGPAYVKQTFQRVMAADPDVERNLADARSQLETINRISQGIDDGEIETDSAEADRLQTMIQELEKQEQIPLREGLALDFPDPVNIIPAKTLTFLPEFLGCPHVTEQYHMCPRKVEEVYAVDLGTQFNAYRPGDKEGTMPAMERYAGKPSDEDKVCVWEIWHKEDGLIYTVADGHKDYLRVEAPMPVTERFWPWFVYAPNWLDDPERPIPPSDVELIMPMQRQVNYTGDSLSEHRYAGRPSHVISGHVSEDVISKISKRSAHSVQSLDLMEGEDVAKKLQPFPTNPIDPNLYNQGPWLQGMLRVSGTQEANLGPTANATATESAIAQSSRQSGDDSAIDELDDLLSDMARAGGQILLQELSAETVAEIVGPGAVWPEASREDIQKEIFLEVEAGSSGRKNQAQEIQAITQMMPLLLQIPGLSPEFLAKHSLNIMDANISLEDALSAGAPSIMALNGQMQAQANNSSGMPEGGSGGNNAPSQEPPGGSAPTPPTPAPQSEV